MAKDKSYSKNQFLKIIPAYIPNIMNAKSTLTLKEDIELEMLYKWFKYQYPQYLYSYFHVKNESTAKHGGHRKDNANKGMLKGVHDVILLVPRGAYGFLTLEMKRSDHKSNVSQEQINFSIASTENMGMSGFCWGFEAGKKFINEYLKGNL